MQLAVLAAHLQPPACLMDSNDGAAINDAAEVQDANGRSNARERS